MRTACLAGGTLLFGFVFGAIFRDGVNPNPVMTIRSLHNELLLEGHVPVLMTGILSAFLVMSIVSNKSICGWGCQLGQLQDLIHQVKLPKWKPKWSISGTIRVGVFAALVTGLTAGSLDIIGIIDPFRIFPFRVTPYKQGHVQGMQALRRGLPAR